MSGEDAFSMKEEVHRWKHAFIEKYGDTDVEELDGEKLSLNELSGAIQAMPFLSLKRLVIIKNFLSTHKAEETSPILPLLNKLSDDTFLLMVETKEPDKRSSAVKVITQMATQRLFLRPKGANLELWIRRRAEALGSKMEPMVASYLVRWVGEELFTLNNEIEKLALYAHARHQEASNEKSQITKGMIDELVSNNTERSIFTLTDQISQKNHDGALRTLRELQNQGEEAGYLFAMITRQFRLLIEIKALLEEGQNAASIAKTMGVHPFVVQSTLTHSKTFTFKQLRKMLSGLLDLDQRLKTGLISAKAREESPFLLELEKMILSS